MKTILITGASSGFGLATAKILAKENKLILLAKDEKRLVEIKKELGNNTYIAGVDIRDRKQVEKFYKSLPEEFSDIYVLVNNAGLATTVALTQESSIEDWDTMIDTNIRGLLYVTRPALDSMIKKGNGQVINISSCSANIPYKGGNVYGGTKAFVSQFSRNLRVDLFGTGIKVTNIEPGSAETNFSVVKFGGDKQKADDYYKHWRPLKSEDIAKAVAWVIDQPPHVNIDNIVIMPLDQTYAGMVLNKKE